MCHAAVRVNSISIHSLHTEGDGMIVNFQSGIFEFQSTPSAWRETIKSQTSATWDNVFQSTPSAWRETAEHLARRIGNAFQSTPSAWRETERQRQLRTGG